MTNRGLAAGRGDRGPTGALRAVSVACAGALAMHPVFAGFRPWPAASILPGPGVALAYPTTPACDTSAIPDGERVQHRRTAEDLVTAVDAVKEASLPRLEELRGG